MTFELFASARNNLRQREHMYGVIPAVKSSDCRRPVRWIAMIREELDRLRLLSAKRAAGDIDSDEQDELDRLIDLLRSIARSARLN